MKKFLVCCCAAVVFDIHCHEGDYYCVHGYNEDPLVNEWLNPLLKVFDIESNICLCGKINVNYNAVHQKIEKNKDSNTVISDGIVDLRYLTKGANHGHGFEVTVGTNSSVIKNGDPIVKGAFLFVEGDKIGEVRLGYSVGASERFLTDGMSILCGYMAVASGNLDKIYNKSTGSIVENGFVYADGNAAKVMWFSPIYKGFSAIFSFTPNGRYKKPFLTKHKAHVLRDSKYDFANDRATAKNILAACLNYEYGEKDSFNFHMNLSGITGKAITNTLNKGEIRDLNSYSIGCIVGYNRVKVALGFTDNCKSFLNKNYATQDAPVYSDTANYNLSSQNVGIRSNADSGKIYSLGLRWDIIDSWATSLGYFRSTVKFGDTDKSTAKIISFATEYSFNKTISAYVEYNNVRTRASNTALVYAKACGNSVTQNNKANIVTIGTAIKF